MATVAGRLPPAGTLPDAGETVRAAMFDFAVKGTAVGPGFASATLPDVPLAPSATLVLSSVIVPPAPAVAVGPAAVAVGAAVVGFTVGAGVCVAVVAGV